VQKDVILALLRLLLETTCHRKSTCRSQHTQGDFWVRPCTHPIPQHRARYREELPWSPRLDTDPDTDEISGLDLFGQQADAETTIKYASFSPYACSRMRTE